VLAAEALRLRRLVKLVESQGLSPAEVAGR
jgi:hypothetical protein